MEYLIHDGHPRVSDCPFCDKPLDGPTVNGLHAECDRQYNLELEEWENSMADFTPAPEGVGWGTTNTPEEKRIDPSKQYKTRSGRSIIGLQIVLANSAGREVTFPVKGSIDMGKGPNGGRRKPRYTIWTLDGRKDLFKETPDDLILAD